MKVLIGALGIGNRNTASKQGGGYEGVKYVFETGHYEEADIFIHALARHEKPDKVLVLVTKEARETSWEYLKEWLDDSGIQSKPINIPSGQNREDAWLIFNKLVSEYNSMFPDDSVIPEILVDITTGLRSIPILMLSVVRYLQQAREINLTGVYYGAYDAVPRTQLEKPVYKLDSFLTLLDWASAVDTFKRTGNSTRLADMLMQASNELSIPNAANIASALGDLSIALDLIRIEQIFKSAHQLVEAIQQAYEGDVPNESQPILNLLNRVGETFEILALKDTRKSIKPLLSKMFDLVDWYASRNRYSDAILLARETFVTWAMTRVKGNDINALFNYQTREKYPHRHTLQPNHRKLWDEIAQIRNDLAHTGMSDSEYRDAEKLQREIDAVITGLRKLRVTL